MGLLSACLIALSLFLLWRLWRWCKIKAIVDQMPGPPAYPFLGNILEVTAPRHKIIEEVMARCQQYGPIFRTWLGVIPAIHIAAPEYMEVILGSMRHTRKGRSYAFLRPWLGEGLLTSSGAKWAARRKLITPAFHFSVLEAFLEVFQDNGGVLVEQLEAVADGRVFDIYPYVTLCALDVICETAMGTQIHAQKSSQSDYINSIYSISTQTLLRAIRIWLHPSLIFKHTALGRQFRKHLGVVHGFTEAVIRERRGLRQGRSEEGVGEVEGKKKRKAFLDLLLDMEEGLTDRELREEVDTFMFEGHDTTTAGICWTLFLLGHHQNIQDEVFSELQDIFQDDPARAVKMGDLGQMKLLERVIKEALRLYPSVPYVSRQLDQDVQLGKYKIPRGSSIVLHFLAMHRSPEVYSNPDRFDPDRFLPDNLQHRHPYAYLPFSAGPRNCIGQKFALAEEKVILSQFLRSYKIHSVDRVEEVGQLGELVLRPAAGIRVKLSKR